MVSNSAGVGFFHAIFDQRKDARKLVCCNESNFTMRTAVVDRRYSVSLRLFPWGHYMSAEVRFHCKDKATVKRQSPRQTEMQSAAQWIRRDN